jgi:hypothetical protein
MSEFSDVLVQPVVEPVEALPALKVASVQLVLLDASSSTQRVTGPERQDEQTGHSYSQTELSPLGQEGHAATTERLVAQRRVGEPAKAGIGVTVPSDEAANQHCREPG